MIHLTIRLRALGLIALCACNSPGREREFDTTRVPSGGPGLSTTPTVPPDSTAGVAKSTGQPGVAGDTVSRSSKISPPRGKAP
jgi:hypothetical protein